MCTMHPKPPLTDLAHTDSGAGPCIARWGRCKWAQGRRTPMLEEEEESGQLELVVELGSCTCEARRSDGHLAAGKTRAGRWRRRAHAAGVTSGRGLGWARYLLSPCSSANSPQEAAASTCTQQWHGRQPCQRAGFGGR